MPGRSSAAEIFAIWVRPRRSHCFLACEARSEVKLATARSFASSGRSMLPPGQHWAGRLDSARELPGMN